MGVKDLWPVCVPPTDEYVLLIILHIEVLLPAGAAVSLTRLSTVDGWDKNTLGLRGLRVGIDAASWLYHGAISRGGYNAALRMMFYRCCDLLSHPFLVVFVFDGTLHPEFKRGRFIISKQTRLIKNFKKLIEMFEYN